jgi:phenylalanyl-tRNA synthetase beta chain
MPIYPPKKNYLRALEWSLRDLLAAKGFLEVYNYSFVREEDKNFTGEDTYITVENPLSEDYTHLRKTLISNLLRHVEPELRTHGHVHFFEFGHVYHDGGHDLPNEYLNLALFVAQIGGDENDMFFQLKSKLIATLDALGVHVTFRPCESPKSFFHPSKCADVIVNGEIIGQFAVLHPQYVPVKNAHIVFAELEAEKLLTHVRNSDIKYKKISAFPSVYRDLSIVLDDKVLIADLEKLAFEI